MISKNEGLEAELSVLRTELQKETDNREKAVQQNVKYQSDFEHISEKLDNERKQLEEFRKNSQLSLKISPIKY